MKRIKLTKGKYALVDDADFEPLSKYNWCVSNGYALRRSSRASGGKNIRMHRVIMDTPDGMFTDHINGDKLDNQRSNLRIVTKSQNEMNKTPNSRNKSGTKGVFWAENVGKWCANIYVNGKNRNLGYFKELDDARAIRIEAENQYFKQYARAY
jgi:hypothetical protein